VIISDAVLPGSSARWGGAGFLLALGVAFLAGFAVSARWGLLIPAGLFVAAAASAAAGEVGLQAVSGAVMLFGLGATFAVLPFAGAPSETRSWAFPVAAVLAAVGAIVLISSITVVAVAWALVLIGAGLLLLLWTALQRQVPRG
jgi:hypothetical protein